MASGGPVEDPFGDLCVQLGLPRPVKEYKFAEDIGRKWRCDWAWPDHKVALELEGLWGRHQTVKGLKGDIEKYNELSLRGFRLLRVIADQMENGEVFELLGRALGRNI